MTALPASMRAPLAAVLIGVTIVGVPIARGAPDDPFGMALPSSETKPPEGVRAIGSSNVDEAMGAASYAYPIEVPAGRLGVQPELALRYSSDDGLRGGVAVGWTLDVPVIERDVDFPAAVRYRTTLTGTSGRLIPNTLDPGPWTRFRAEVDSSFTRYELDPGFGTWIARTTDGSRYEFGLVYLSRAYLTKRVDPFGNTITYVYEDAHSSGHYGKALKTIEYSSNPGSGFVAHAKVELMNTVGPACGGLAIGASTDRAFGHARVSGARTLNAIQTFVRETPSAGWRLARTYALGYDGPELACDQSALRWLSRIDVTAFTAAGTPTTAPPVQFGYGAKQRTLTRTVQWPLAPRDGGTTRGPTSAFMDLDGDGRTDAVRVLTQPDGCYVEWRAGGPDGGFGFFPQTFKLPSARWRNAGAPDPGLESCTLSGQIAARPVSGNNNHCWSHGVHVNYQFIDYDADGVIDILSWLSGDWSDADGDFSFTNDVVFSTSGGGGMPPGCADAMHPIGEAEGLICACDAPSAAWDGFFGGCRAACGVGSTYDVNLGQCAAVPSDGISYGPGGGSDPDVTECENVVYQPQRIGAEFVWYVQHRGPGGYQPLDLAARKYSPRPLSPSGAAELSIPSSVFPGLPTLTDLDGDGYLDVVGLSSTPGAGLDPIIGQTTGIYVWRGNGDHFASAPVLWAFEAGWSQWPQDQIGTPQGGFHLYQANRTLTLRDVNGDGAPDLLAQTGPWEELAVAYNQPGDWMYVPNQTVAGTFSPMIPLGLSSPTEAARNEITDWRSNLYLRGVRGLVRRLIDFDGDGATELVMQDVASSVSAPANSWHRRRLVGGATSLAVAPMTADWEPLEARVRGSGFTWKRDSDFVDLTGDGLPDPISYDAGGAIAIRTDPVDNASLRKLTTVDNGRGGAIRYEYAWSTDSAVVTAVGPNQPRAVIARIVETAGFGQPDQRARYRYTTPVVGKRGASDPRPMGFIGYGGVTIERSGQAGDATTRIDKTFGYGQLGFDTSARPATELVSIRTGTTYTPVTHTHWSHGWAPLANSAASATYVTATVERTCAAGATATTCAAQPPTLTTTETWTPWAPSGVFAQALLHTRTETEDLVSSDRYLRRDYAPRWTATDSRLLMTVEERGHVDEIPIVGGVQRNSIPSARTQTVYNAAGLPEDTRVYKDASTYATTRRTFHPVGVELSVKHPNEVAAGVWNADFTAYDGFALYPSAHTNRHNQSEYVTHDIATGTMVLRKGPNYRATAPNVYVDDQERWTIDGFGRVLTRSDSLEPAVGVAGYDYRPVETIQYFDAELPNRRVVSRLLDVPTNRWVIDETRYDGRGRVTEDLAKRQLAGQPDQRTVYAYDAAGTIARIDTTSPATDEPPGTLVSTVFTRDGLGRLTSLIRPDGFHEDTVFTGLEALVTQQSPTDGTGERTTLRKNAYGELFEVHEHDNPIAGVTAITRSWFDAQGRVHRVVDADGATTNLGHDWRGRRTSITRGSRTWGYAYDLNGNLTSELEPIPAGGTIGLYTSSTTYDKLDRPLVITPAARALTATRRTQLGLGAISYAYDGNNFVGKPHAITLPFGTIGLIYEANGQVARETRAFTLNQGVTLAPSQWVERRYDALGNPAAVKFDDGTEWRYGYDHRAAISDVKWRVPGSPTGAEIVLAHYDRQVAGQPIVRTSALAPQRRDWAYDVNGRVTYDRVSSTATGTTWHERDYGYDGHGELRAISGATNGMTADADYAYDARHRLRTAVGPGAYSAAFTYSPAGNVATAIVAGATDVPNRDVNYVYGAVDPQAVDRITDRTTGATVATWSYDLAGNNTARAVGAQARTYTFGGDGLLHESAGAGGTERYYFGADAERIVALGPTGVTIWFGESETLYGNSGTQQRRYFHIAAGEPIARAERTTPTSTHTIELQYADALQNLAVTVSSINAVTAAFTYGGFGEVVGATGASNHRREFNGKEHDLVSGLHHYGWRSYDPVSLRWASADPLYRFSPDAAWGEPQRANLYAFSLNNALSYYDPDGRAPKYGSAIPARELRNAAVDKLADVAAKKPGDSFAVLEAKEYVVGPLVGGIVLVNDGLNLIEGIDDKAAEIVEDAVFSPPEQEMAETEMVVDEQTSTKYQLESREAPAPGPKKLEPKKPNKPDPSKARPKSDSKDDSPRGCTLTSMQ